MKLKWRKQSNKSNCGQLALSVITGLGLKEIYKIIGHDHGTKTKELARCLRKLGYKCPSRLKRLKEPPELAIAKLKIPNIKYNWHWVVIYKDKIYDGVNGNSKGKVNWKNGRKITSYLPIKKI